MESFTSKEMQGKKVRDVYVKVYGARETTFLDQTGVISCPISEIVNALTNGVGKKGQVRRS